MYTIGQKHHMEGVHRGSLEIAKEDISPVFIDILLWEEHIFIKIRSAMAP